MSDPVRTALKIVLFGGLAGVAFVDERVNYRGRGVFRRVRSAKARDDSRDALKRLSDLVAKALASPPVIPPAYVQAKVERLVGPPYSGPASSSLLWLDSRSFTWKS